VEGHLNRYISVIYMGNLLQYKSIYSSCMYIVLEKVPEYRYPLYFEKFKNRADFAMLTLMLIRLIHAD
jgi:hypothetical protein